MEPIKPIKLTKQLSVILVFDKGEDFAVSFSLIYIKSKGGSHGLRIFLDAGKNKTEHP
jgi:hypothetical protein